MKATVKNTKQEFTPIELTITIESDQELTAFNNLFGYNQKLAKYLVDNDFIESSYKDEFAIISGQLFDLLDK